MILFTANVISFLVIGLAYILYSKLLSPEEFGLYSIALVIGTFGVLILDGGLKNTIIKSHRDLTEKEQGTLLFFMTASSIFLLIVLVVAERPLVYFFPSVQRDYKFLAFFAGVYFLSYPFIAIPTALLERRLDYKRIAWIESAAIALERGSPVYFLLWSGEGIYSFFWGVLLGRLFRVACLNLSSRVHVFIPSWKQFLSTFHFMAEGGWLQLATGASLIRDNLHILLVGPIFGKEWVGYYAWALQLCLIASQVFVQIYARVSLPVFAKAKGFEDRWQICMYQIRLLTMLTGPILVATLILIPAINRHFFLGKWQEALGLLPLLFIRMLPGLATTPAGTLLMVQRGARVFAGANILWTTVEVLGACLLLFFIGPKGLVWSYAAGVWIGLWFLLRSFGMQTHKLTVNTLGVIFRHPSLAVSVASLIVLFFYYYMITGLNHELGYSQLLVVAVPVLIASYLSESEVQRFLRIRH